MNVKQELVADFIRFLDSALQNGDVPSDEQESVELAAASLRDAFGIEEGAGSDGLVDLYTRAKSAAPAASANVTAASADSYSEGFISEEDKAEAEQLKLEGNRLMAHKKFNEAVQAYSLAIEKNPHSALFFSNRAAAHSQLKEFQKAADDARQAVEIDPGYSKAFSRLGLALWSLGDLKGSLDAYERGLAAEGENPTEAMKRDYLTVKKKYDEQLLNAAVEAKSQKPSTAASSGVSQDPWAASEKSVDTDASAGASAAGGFPGLGGLGGLGGLSGLMQNPELQRMAQQLMSSNPGMLNDLMSSPAAQKVRESFQNGSMPNFSELAQDETLQNMMKNFGGSSSENE